MTIGALRFTRHRWGLETWAYHDCPPPPIACPPAAVTENGELVGHWGDHIVPRDALAPPDLPVVRAGRRRARHWMEPARDAMCERHRAPLTANAAHRVLVLCSRAEDALVREMAHTLRRLRDRDAWGAFGLTRLEDYARERLGISRRWAQELIRFDRTLERSEPLRRAFDAGTLSTAKVLALAPFADRVGTTIEGVEIPEDCLEQWIATAPTKSVRVLRNALREVWLCLEHLNSGPTLIERMEAGEEINDAEDDAEISIPEQLEVETPERVRVAMRVPAPVRLLHEFAVDTARAMSGHGCSEGQAVEMMLADHVARHGLPDEKVASDRVHRPPLPDDRNPIWRDPTCEPYQCASEPPVEEIFDTVRLIDGLLGADIPDAPRNLDRHLRRLVRARQRRRAETQRVLHHLHRHRLWRVLGYRSFASYCERVLGIARRTAEEMVALDTSLARLPETARAFAEGGITAEKAKALVQIATPETERAWLDRADIVTARYFRCEVETALDRRAADGCDPVPLALSTLPPYAMASPVRPGAALERLIENEEHARAADDGEDDARTCAHADAEASADDTSLAAFPRTIPPGRAFEPRWIVRFMLPREVHDVFLTIDTDIARRRPGSTRWQRYLALLVEVLDAWHAESDEARRRTATYRTLERDGFMCAVPGCTERLALESHHVIFRSRGGDDATWNRISVCPTHHRLAIHGTWAVTVTGNAPAELTWEMGSETYVGDVRACA